MSRLPPWRLTVTLALLMLAACVPTLKRGEMICEREPDGTLECRATAETNSGASGL